ncbi:cyclase family protein [Haloferax sp. MBLA0076]|uniref:Cyclase family protein n=1 Tax=Haloferax litoreum TaxID=2666140 RepID=A0A6A8GK13_9EURY|nr:MULTISPECIES: cyclase family protein [Haloferax]KAB1193863.1 cyclase family protein [Haloferax sp. CBA1148]MRX22407.1 cyclase family protein [Haloferax litoreum]
MTLVDLTRRVESGMPTYPGDPAVSVESHADFDADGYRVSRLELGTHTGTHVDAPAHTEADGATLDSYSVEDLRFTAQVVDCRDAGANGLVTAGVIPAELDPDVDCLVFRTGWEDEWGTVRMTDHPALAPETGQVCADRGFSVALDALSPDPTGGDGVPVHHAVLGAGNLIVENLRGLEALPTDRSFDLFVLPLRVDADGAPARVVAEV